MAEAFGKMIGSKRYQFLSAGSKPSGNVNPKAIRSMSKIGYDMTQHRSKGINELPQDGVDVMISMGCGDACPQIPAKIRSEWEIPDPKLLDDKEYAKIAQLIEAQVVDLIDQINNS